MKSGQLLSIVFSLIMFTGVTAGSVAYAQSDDLEDLIEDFCEMSSIQQNDFFSDYPDMEEFKDELSRICDMESEDERENLLEALIDETIPETIDFDDYLEDMLDRFCEMTDEEKQELISKYYKTEDHVDKMNQYCELDEDERDAYLDEQEDKFRMNHDKNMKDMLTRYCEMSEQDRIEFLAEHDKSEDHTEKMNQYCNLDEDARMDFIAEHKDEYKKHMKDKMMDKRPHIDYDKICALSESERALEIDDSEKLDKISNWCDMTPEEREDYKKEHHDQMKDKSYEKAMDKEHDKMKMSDVPPHLKSMIMDKHDISDERMDEIKMKFKEKHGDFTDEEKLELEMKFKDHMSSMKFKMSDEHKSVIHDRLAEMKDFKAELLDRSSTMTDEEKQELRAEFIETAKDMHLAWISPRAQMLAGIDAVDIECREGFSLVVKASNGVPMCLNADTALKMIERGIAVPVN